MMTAEVVQGDPPREGVVDVVVGLERREGRETTFVVLNANGGGGGAVAAVIVVVDDLSRLLVNSGKRFVIVEKIIKIQ